MQTTIIIGGGTCDINFIKDLLMTFSESERVIVACDRGLDACLKLGLRPDFCIGDFDSAGQALYQKALDMGLNITKLIPEKDDTDSEAALKLSIEKTQGKIIFVGCTGTRLDHVLGNIALLGMAKKMGRDLFLMDKNNKAYILGPGEGCCIEKNSQHGKYVSVIPYMGPVTGLNLLGFKYPMENGCIKGFDTLTVSNEVVEEKAFIEHKEGFLVVLETMD